MADNIYEELKKEKAKKRSLTESVTVRLTVEEKAVLEQKSGDLSMSNGELLREYILRTPAFKKDTPPKPKAVVKEAE